jgi:hypothetical protein
MGFRYLIYCSTDNRCLCFVVLWVMVLPAASVLWHFLACNIVAVCVIQYLLGYCAAECLFSDT